MSKVEEDIENYLKKCEHFTQKEYDEVCALYGKKNVELYFNKLYRTTDEENLDKFLNKYHDFIEQRESKSDDNIETITKNISMEIETSSFLKYYINKIKDKKILTPDTERALFTELSSLRTNLKFLNIIDCLELKINYLSIFMSIKDDTQIKSLIKLYKAKYISNSDYEYIINDEDERKLIKKYLKLYEKNLRPLTEEEILANFPKINTKHQQKVSKTEYDAQIDNLIKFLTIVRELEYSNLKLVFSRAKPRKEQLPIEDLIQEGNIGLRKAILMFDSTKGYKFSTYASWWIKQAQNRAVISQRDIIRKPFHIGELLRKYRLKYGEQLSLTGKAPTTKEMAEILDITEEKCEELEKLAIEPLSLNLTYGEDEDYTLLNTLSNERFNPQESIEAIVNMKSLKSDIANILLTLTPKEADVIIQRFGLGDSRPKTLEEIGGEYGVTRERIRQIEAKALRKLRSPNRSNKLKDYYKD